MEKINFDKYVERFCIASERQSYVAAYAVAARELISDLKSKDFSSLGIKFACGHLRKLIKKELTL